MSDVILLLIVLDDLFKVYKVKLILKWRQLFESYLKIMFFYYFGVRRILLKQILNFLIIFINNMKIECIGNMNVIIDFSGLQDNSCENI